ncbi:MAG: elongation factor G [Oscillospiraceae bacterium]|jgi:elongation factor G|nr:elongation factor G [Oscillospiraceae bacterium]
MAIASEDIRNIALVGHGQSGKTSLLESILYMTGAIDRQGRTNDGNTVSDSDGEEIKRKISVSLSTASAEYKGTRVNLLDTPGYFDFAGEVAQALRVADGGVIVAGAKDGLTVGFEKAWKQLADRGLPRAVFISKVDEENADYESALNAIRGKYGASVCPLIAPIKGAGGKVDGVIDLIDRRAYKLENGKRVEIPVPDSMAAELESLYTAVNESVAETDEELMEKYFAGEEFTLEEKQLGLRRGVRGLTLFPVLCGIPTTGLGTLLLLDAITQLFPSAADGKPDVTDDGTEVKVDPNGQPAVIVYKTLSDQYGKYNLFKVITGRLTNEASLTNSRTGTAERLGHIYKMQGRKSVEVKELVAGDLGAASKLTDTKTGDTLRDAKSGVTFAPVVFAEPCYSMAIAPKTKGQEDKIAAGLTRLADEDPSFTVVNNSETKQMVVSGAGDIQLDVLCSKLRDKFVVETVLHPARVAYREKIRKTVEVQGRHKKQSGGHGQFGDVKIRFEPGEEEDLTFSEEVFGGAVPRNFFPAVEKGLRDSISKGILAGYPVVYLKATLFDGSYHPVDSSEMAFKTAAQLAYKDGIPKANPVILEPIGNLKVLVPDSYTGDIMSDLSKRRGSPLGMGAAGDGLQEIEAEVPMGEMSAYAIDLRSITQGRGSFSLKFVRYQEAPGPVQQKIIDEAKALNSEE